MTNRSMAAGYIRISLITTLLLQQFITIKPQCNGTTKTIEVGYKASFLKYPESGEYPTNEVCQWLLTSTVSGPILYKSTNISINYNDTYSIYDGSSVSDPAKESDISTGGSIISKPLDRSSGQNLFLRFVSDETAAIGKDNGFTIYFVSSPDLSLCTVNGTSRILNASETLQAFTSPLFPNIYPKNRQCTWIILPSTQGATVTLSLHYIDIDVFRFICYDKITIRYENLSVDVCGDENFSPTNTYTGRNISVTFSSDGIQEESGFVAVYSETEEPASTSTGTTTTPPTSMATTTTRSPTSKTTSTITSTAVTNSITPDNATNTFDNSTTPLLSTTVTTTEDTNSSSSSEGPDDGLSNGAVVGIVIGTLAVVGSGAVVAAEITTGKISSLSSHIREKFRSTKVENGGEKSTDGTEPCKEQNNILMSNHEVSNGAGPLKHSI